MTEIAHPLNADALYSELSTKVKRLSLWVAILSVILILSIGSLTFLAWRRAKSLDEEQKNLAFSLFVTDYNSSTDFVVPQVNTIQFLRRGYSITFSSVKYTQEGLELTGTLGNATELWINNLAVNFVARPYPYKVREKWDKQRFPWWADDWNIGSGQTTVGTLNQGASVPFSVTIPNVKQTSDSIEIAVSFSGERYSYLK